MYFCFTFLVTEINNILDIQELHLVFYSRLKIIIRKLYVGQAFCLEFYQIGLVIFLSPRREKMHYKNPELDIDFNLLFFLFLVL